MANPTMKKFLVLYLVPAQVMEVRPVGGHA